MDEKLDCLVHGMRLIEVINRVRRNTEEYGGARLSARLGQHVPAYDLRREFNRIYESTDKAMGCGLHPRFKGELRKLEETAQHTQKYPTYPNLKILTEQADDILLSLADWAVRKAIAMEAEHG